MIRSTYEKAEGRKWAFHCGTQYMDWQNKWCCRCKFAPKDEQGWYRLGMSMPFCEILVQMLDGTLAGDDIQVPDQLEDRDNREVDESYYDCYICTKFEQEVPS